MGEGANAGDFARLMLQLTQKDLEAMRRHRSLSCDSHQRSDWRLLRCLYQCTPVGLGWVGWWREKHRSDHEIVA